MGYVSLDGLSTIKASLSPTLHIFFLNGINDYLDTRFSVEDMREIYTHLGNACNHQKTIRFIESGYDMAVLEEQD